MLVRGLLIDFVEHPRRCAIMTAVGGIIHLIPVY
jgi:hypothetical protein